MNKKKEIYPVIYKITCLGNSKIYIGSAINFDKRKWIHLSELRKNKHANKYLQNSWNKYGEDNFEFEIIDKDFTEDLATKEQYWMDFYQCFAPKDGFNICKEAYNCKGRPVSEETRLKMSLKKKGIPLTKEHTENIKKAIKINHPSSGKIRKDKHVAIKCFDLNGIFLQNYESVTKASKELKICIPYISSNLTGKYKQAKGYVFFYKDFEIPNDYFPVKRYK